MSASIYLRPARDDAPAVSRFRHALDYAFVFLVVVTASGALYKFGVASVSWALIYAGALLLFAADRRALLAALQSTWVLLIFPTFCLVSVFWSVEPVDTLRHAVQYGFTALLAFWIGARFSLERLFSVTAAALVFCVALSVAGAYLGVIDGTRQGDYVGAERYFVGLYTQKNVFGNVIVYAALALLATGAVRAQSVRFSLVAAALLPVLWLTKSTTALLLYGLAWSFFPAVWLAKMPRNKAFLFFAAMLVLIAGAGVLIALGINPLSDFLAMFGKDTTLTGRTVIWDRGMEIYLQRPFLGLGYQAFWESPAYASDVMLIRAAVLESIGGFHNGYLEAMVATGLVGAVFYGLLMISALVIVIKAASTAMTPVRVAGVFFAIVIVSRTFTESSVYYQHDLDFVLLIAIAVSSLQGRTAMNNENEHV